MPVTPHSYGMPGKTHTGQKVDGLRHDGQTAQEVRLCQWPDCSAHGEFRAPRSRDELRTYRWFCLDHIRQYNARWNYYAGMTDAEVEADIRRDTVWQRPSWRWGTGPLGVDKDHIEDSFGLFDETGADRSDQARAAMRRSPEEEALLVLDLRPPITLETVKARYKELVKRHHPDANGGCKTAEEKFKRISEAYQTVISGLVP